MKTRTQQLGDLKAELAEYVSFRARRSTPMTFQQALRAHQEAIRDCFADDPETFRERLDLLDQLMQDEGLFPVGRETYR